jgi:hypothetical protein
MLHTLDHRLERRSKRLILSVVYPWSRPTAARKEAIRHMITDEHMRAAAAALADEGRENYGGVDVISVGPAVSALMPFGQRYSVLTIIPERAGQDFVGHDVILVGAESDPMLATVYRMALVIALEEFFACVRIFGSENSV